MDKHKALIEQISAFLQERDESLWPSERSNDERQTSATHILNAVYEALKEPTPEMITTGDDAIDECVDFYDNAFGSGYTVEGRASRSTWQAMLAASALSSPLGKGERQPVDSGENKR